MSNFKKRTGLAIVLAAGEGTRMKSSLPKVLNKLAGLELVNHVFGCVKTAKIDHCAVVTGAQQEMLKTAIGDSDEHLSYYQQTQRLGTAHAVQAASAAIERGFDDVIVLFGDTPLLTADTLQKMRQCLADGADVAVMGFRTQNPHGYGRMIEKDGQLLAIREHKEATEKERDINFCNGGIMAINGAICLDLINLVSNDNAKDEYYLTDIVEIAHKKNMNVVAQEGDEAEILGINTRAELAEVEILWQRRRRKELMLSGVSMQAPDTVFLSHDTIIGPDTVLEPFQVFGTSVRLGGNVLVRGYCHFEQCQIDDNCEIGPYARLRPDTVIAKGAKVGNFVEIKKSTLDEGAKVNHLSYIGDATIGAGANIGAGTITCNYDGVNKHQTHIGAGAFIGSNSALVAPVTVGENAYVGSGSVVTKDAPAESLVISRARQTIMEGRASLLKNKALALKANRTKNKNGG